MKKKLPFTFRLTVYLLIVNCQLSIVNSLPAQLPQILDLQGPWQFREHGGKDWLPAQVPGTVHTDLLAANLIQWIEQLDWEYRRTILLTEQQLAYAKADIIFDGLDTYADIYLNGQLLQHCDNMHRRWVVPCKPYLQVGENELRVEFHSPMQVAMAAYTASPFQLPAGNDAAEIKLSPYVRKAAYHFGWDFGPRFVTAGIWRPAHLRLWDHAILEDLNARPLELLPLEAKMLATIDLDIATPGNYQINLLAEGELLLSADRELDRGKQRVELQFTLHNPRFWWPKGMGEPALYDLQAQVRRNQETLDEKHQSLGLRTIQLIRQSDSMGTSFYFSINGFLPQGGPLYIKGANHVPADAFLPRARSRETQLLEAAEAVGMNMLRVWGGGTYADDHFYQWCDSHGILIWQDLAFACMMYPLEGPFLENALAEVEENVQRLRNHPSLAIWCGNNEIAVAWQNWGWQQQFGYSEAFSHQLWSQYQNFFDHHQPPEQLGQGGEFQASQHALLGRMAWNRQPRRFQPTRAPLHE
jgi:beta-mannosidase